MYKNKSSDGKNNICGIRIKGLRQSLPEKTSQRRFSPSFHSEGLNSLPDERKEGETMYVTYADLIDTK